MSEPKLENLTKVELPKFDPTPYVGQFVLVDEVTIEMKERDEKKSYYIQFKALVEPKCEQLNGEPLYATRNIGIQQDANGMYGWGEETVMAKFLAKHNIAHPMEMKGKKVQIVTQKDTTYLTF